MTSTKFTYPIYGHCDCCPGPPSINNVPNRLPVGELLLSVPKPTITLLWISNHWVTSGLIPT